MWEDCLLFLYVLCYDNKNEAAGFLGVIMTGDLPAQYTFVENFAIGKILLCKGRLREARSDFVQNPDSTVIRDGVIQRFEFTIELTWKSLREYLEDQGADMRGIVFSKQVFKAVYAAQIIIDQQVWLDMLASRNITSHMYDDAQAAQVVADISGRYIGPFTALAERYLKV